MAPEAPAVAERPHAPPPSDPQGHPDPLETYGRREAEATGAAGRWRERSDALAQQRMWVFLMGAAAFVGYAFATDAKPLFTGGGLLLMVLFVVFVVRHRRARRHERWHSELAQVAREARYRRLRNWDGLEQPSPAAPENHPYADDLDVFGHASLYTLLGTTATRPGADTLVDWLLAPAPVSTVRERQAAVRELTPAIEFRDELHAAGRIAGPVEMKEIARLLEWAEAPTWLVEERAVMWAAVVLPLATIVTTGIHVAGMAPFLWMGPVGLTLLLMKRLFGRIHEDFALASNGETGLRRYHELIARIAEQRFEASLLTEHREKLTPDGEAAAEALARLFHLMEMSDLRFNGQVHFPVNLLTLWDVHILVRMERWKEIHGRNLRGWMEALGRVDALSALAGLGHCHPDWVFPEVGRTDPKILDGGQLGHPLLNPETAVRNDVEVGPPGSLLLVTGSNMSGKSTLLRALGANVVLAGAGGPVCAASMRPPHRRPSHQHAHPGTPWRRGSPTSWPSSSASSRWPRRPEPPGTCRSSTSLDEILQGTNTAERQIAARRILTSPPGSGDHRRRDHPRSHPGRCTGSDGASCLRPLRGVSGSARRGPAHRLRLQAPTGNRHLHERASAHGDHGVRRAG